MLLYPNLWALFAVPTHVLLSSCSSYRVSNLQQLWAAQNSSLPVKMLIQSNYCSWVSVIYGILMQLSVANIHLLFRRQPCSAQTFVQLTYERAYPWLIIICDFFHLTGWKMRTPIFSDGSLITVGLPEAKSAQPFNFDSGSNVKAISCVHIRMLL